MDFELVNYNELKKIVPFSIFVIQYFKNDFKVIRDFLIQKSPWDDNIKCFFKINDTELLNKKKLMIKSIIKVYSDIIEKPIIKKAEDSGAKISSVDYYYFEALSLCKNKFLIFFTYENVSLILLRIYVDVLSNKYKINIDTGNYFKTYLLKIVDYYEYIYEKFKMTEYNGNKQYIEKYVANLVDTIDNYFKENFRTIEDFKLFLDYYFSIVYAYLKSKKDVSDSIEIESKFIECYENKGVSLYDVFCNNFDIRYYLIVNLYDIYMEYDENFDIRDNLNDAKSIKLFVNRDINYSKKNRENFIIDNYNLEFKMEILITNIFKFTKDEVKLILLDKESIYNILYFMELDARYSDYYKEKIIKKILCDCYSFYIYLSTVTKEYENKVISSINDISSDDAFLVKYFKTNFEDIYNFYLEYLNSSKYIKEQVLINVLKLDKLREIERISNYTLAQYFDILLGKLKQLPSVDCMNYYINNINDPQNIDDIIYKEYGIDNMIRVIVLNVYENIVLSKELTKEQQMIKIVVEDVIDISTFAQNNKPFLDLLINMFISFNKDNISYNEENDKREKINSTYVKCILRRINPYQEG